VLSLFGLVAPLLPILAPLTLAPTPVSAAPGDLQLITQSFNVPADGAISATVALPAALAGADLSTALFAVTVYERVEKREDLLPIVSGALNRPDDTVVISPLCCAGAEAGQFTLSIPLEVSEVLPTALSLPRAGLYPVSISVQRDGRVLSKILTFVNRLPAAGETTDPDALSVAFAIGTRSSIRLDSKSTSSLDPSTVTEMTSLADALDALDANKIPATVRVAPAVLAGLQQLDQPLFSRLVTSLQSHQLVAEPQWPIDPSVAAAARQDSLYTSWLRAGQDRLSDLGLGPSTISRSTIFADQPIGAEGATLRRNLGAGLLVMAPSIYDGLHGSIKDFSDYLGELVPAELPNKTVLDVAVVDHKISAALADPLATPAQTAVFVVSQLLALRQNVETAGESPASRAIVIGSPDLGVPDAALLGSIAALIAQTPGLAVKPLDDVAVHTDRLVLDGTEQSVTLPSVDGRLLEQRIFKQAVLNNDIDAAASMLPDGDERPAGWRELAALLPTTALDDSDAEGLIDSIESDVEKIKAAVQMPAAYTVTLPGRRSTVRVRFLNNSTVPLKIRVQLSSPSGKLVFANDPNPIELPPGVPLLLPIAVEARSNGTSPVSLDVSTPNDVQLGDTVPLTFRVRALDLGNVITVVLFVLVLLWWLEHWRSTWRKRRRREAATLPDS